MMPRGRAHRELHMDGRLAPKARRVALQVTYSFFVGFLIDFFFIRAANFLSLPPAVRMGHRGAQATYQKPAAPHPSLFLSPLFFFF